MKRKPAKPIQRRPMPKPRRAIATKLDDERRKRWNNYLALWRRANMEDELCQG